MKEIKFFLLTDHFYEMPSSKNLPSQILAGGMCENATAYDFFSQCYTTSVVNVTSAIYTLRQNVLTAYQYSGSC